MRIGKGIKLWAFFLSAVCVFCAGSCFAGDVSVFTDLNKRKLYVGDVCVYSITLRSSSVLEVKFPGLSGDLAECEISSPRIILPGFFSRHVFFMQKTYRCVYKIVPFSVGKHSVGRLDLQYKETGKNDWDSYKLPQEEFNVVSILEDDPKDIRLIKEPLSASRSNLLIFLAATVILMIAAALVFLRRKPKAVETMPVNVNIVNTPQDVAFRKLSEIKSGINSGEDDIKQSYVEISNCLRKFLEKTLNIKAPDMTTEEFLEDLKFSPKLSNEQKKLLEEFMLHCDMVKFAKYRPSEKEVDLTLKSAFRMVEQIRGAGK